MPDISMRNDKGCPARVACYRYRAKPGENQSYEDFKRGTKNRCPLWLPIYPDDPTVPMQDIEQNYSER